jgi:hypothetical protein
MLEKNPAYLAAAKEIQVSAEKSESKEAVIYQR